MSRMFAYDSYSSDSDDSFVDRKVVKPQNKLIEFSSDSEDDKRVVKSAKDKRLEEIFAIKRNINNHKKIRDNAKLMNDLDELLSVYEKSKKLNDFGAKPKFFIRSLGEFEDYIKEQWEIKKDLTKSTAKALNVLKQKVKKVTRDFEPELKNYHENPDDYREESAEEKESESEDEHVEEFDPHVEMAKKQASSEEEKSGSDSSDDDSEFSDDSGSDSDSASSDSSLDPLNMEKYRDNLGLFFLKVNVEARAREKARRKGTQVKEKRVKKQREKQVDKQLSDDDGGDWIMTDGTSKKEPRVIAFDKGADVTVETVIKKLEEIMADRGKQNVSTPDQISLLTQVEQKISEMNFGIGLQLKTIISLITVLFDYEAKTQMFMPTNKFQKVIDLFTRLYDLLENTDEEVTLSKTIKEEDEQLTEAPFMINGCIIQLTCTLDDEFLKILRNVNGHEVEYVERLRDERLICNFLDRLCKYLEAKNESPENICVVYLRKVEHLYYKFDFEWAKNLPDTIDDQVATDDNFHHSDVPEHESVAEMRRLCEYIYSHDTTDRLRTRAMLCHIYHLALYGYWFRSRDLMLMSNLQASIDHADQSTMILYNRAMVQLGLCAFRQGHIKDAHHTLVDITGSMRVRELLAQHSAQNRYYDRTTEEEMRDRSLQVPYHMHINTDLLECVYLVSTMLLEIPLLAAHESDMRWRLISKSFHQALRIHDRSILSAPPESPRDHVIIAAKSMRVGNWDACVKYLINPKMDAKIWNLFFHPERIKRMLIQRVKEESLRSYLFMYSAVHDSISLERLADHFDLPKSTVYSIISKMIINQELAASLEVPSDFLIMHKTERSRLQTLALQLSDKVNGIVEMNEKLIDSRGGNQLGNKSFQQQGLRRTQGKYNQSVKFKEMNS